MFLDFFLILKNQGLPVSLKEYLTLLEALDKEVVAYNVDDFYVLSRTILVKHEQHLDKFDRIFGEFFQRIEQISTEEFKQIPEEWLRKNSVKELSAEEKALIKALGGFDKLMERFKELLKEQKERHEGGNKWIGTGGTSPFGAYGYNPEGYRIGQEGSRHRKAIKVWDKREFQNLDDNRQLDTRQFKMALRRLRMLTREGQAEEFHLEETIRRTSRNGGMLDVAMVPPKTNNVKVLLFLDVGGSMDDYIELCEQLFTAARYEFKHLEYFYFHNCLYERVWKDNRRRWNEAIPTEEILHKFGKDYKVIIVGDASMSPYEIIYAGGSVEHVNKEPGTYWLNRFKEQFKDIIWLNPVAKAEWQYIESIGMLQNAFDNKMFPLTLAGIEEGVKKINKKVK